MRTERKELRLTAEMVEAVNRARGDVSFNRFVERTLEAALGTCAGPAASPRASVESRPVNKGRSPVFRPPVPESPLIKRGSEVRQKPFKPIPKGK